MADSSNHTRPLRSSLDFHSASIIAARIADDKAVISSNLETCGDESLPRIDGYQILELLGQGASGRVYLAIRRGSDRPVAIKLHTGQLESGGRTQRATRELDLLSGIRHPHVVNVLDYGMFEGQLWIATEFVDGTPLDARCADSSFSTRQRVELLAKVCDAVQGLHEFGVIHRDLKPDNILVDENSQPVIIDLGIASLMSGDVVATLTQEGSPIGTPAFMSPEQARGERTAISTRSDVYSLGAIGYLLLTGDTPHPGDATIHELIRRVAQDEPRDARAIEPEIPKGLAAVIGKAVHRLPTSRYASSAELAADLRRWLKGEQVTAVRPGPWARASRWVGRHPIVTTALMSAVLSLGIIGGVLVVIWRLNQMPAEVRILDGGRIAILYAKSGRPLYEWRSRIDEGIRVARIVDRPMEFGGGKAILTVIQGFDGDTELDEQLCLWNIHNPDQLIWSTSATPPFIKAPEGPLPSSTSEDFYGTLESYNVGRYLLVADVFPESPGDEIIAVHSHHSIDPQAIRVYDMAGQVLYETWHWGSVGEIFWMEQPGVLVCRGMNNEIPWPDRGYPEVKLRFPVVVFALKPQLNTLHGWINGPSADARIELQWYKFLWPPEATDNYDVHLKSPSVATLRGTCVLLELRVAGSEASVCQTLNAAGEPALPKPLETDLYKALEDPPPWEFVDEIPDAASEMPIEEGETGGG